MKLFKTQEESDAWQAEQAAKQPYQLAIGRTRIKGFSIPSCEQCGEGMIMSMPCVPEQPYAIYYCPSHDEPPQDALKFPQSPPEDSK